MTHCILAAAVTVVAFAALFGLIRHRRWHRWQRYHSMHGCAGGPGPGFGAGPRWMMRGILDRLGTSVAQEKVIVEAVDGVRGQGRKLWDELKQADVAEALRGESLDPAKVDGAFARQEGAMAELRKALTAALGKVHEALDPEQRRELASMLERPYAFHGGCC